MKLSEIIRQAELKRKQEDLNEMLRSLISQDLIVAKAERIKLFHNQILREAQNQMNIRYHGSEKRLNSGLTMTK